MITEHDRVVLTAPVPKERLEVGDVGTVVHVYPDGKAFEVEFTTLDGRTGRRGHGRAPGLTCHGRRHLPDARQFGGWLGHNYFVDCSAASLATPHGLPVPPTPLALGPIAALFSSLTSVE